MYLSDTSTYTEEKNLDSQGLPNREPGRPGLPILLAGLLLFNLPSPVGYHAAVGYFRTVFS